MAGLPSETARGRGCNDTLQGLGLFPLLLGYAGEIGAPGSGCNCTESGLSRVSLLLEYGSNGAITRTCAELFPIPTGCVAIYALTAWLPHIALLDDFTVQSRTCYWLHHRAINGRPGRILAGNLRLRSALLVKSSCRPMNWYPRQELHPHDDVRSVAS